MQKKPGLSSLLLALSFLLFIPSRNYAADSITLTTYYPSPYGVYNEIRSKRMAIGETYYNTGDFTWEEADADGGQIDYLADLVVEGNIGIGTTNPLAILDINGTGPANSYALMRLARGGLEKTMWIRALDNSHVDLVSSGQLRLVTSGSETYNDANNKIGLTVETTGYLGIGTTAPLRPFEVLAATNFADWPASVTGGTATGKSYGFHIRAGTNASDASFAIDQVGGDRTFVVTGAGNVGIGTTNPARKLHVNGGAELDGTVVGNGRLCITYTNCAWTGDFGCGSNMVCPEGKVLAGFKDGTGCGVANQGYCCEAYLATSCQ